MVVYKKKKHRKLLGHTTHGWGSRKKRRGSGSRGGVGNAGTGKRAGQKKTNPETKVIGQRGFTSKSRTRVKAINLGYFTKDRVNRLLAQNLAKKEGSLTEINLESLGYNKLLGAGTPGVKLKIIVQKVSASVEEKVKSMGGEVIFPNEEKKKEVKRKKAAKS